MCWVHAIKWSILWKTIFEAFQNITEPKLLNGAQCNKWPFDTTHLQQGEQLDPAASCLSSSKSSSRWPWVPHSPAPGYLKQAHANSDFFVKRSHDQTLISVLMHVYMNFRTVCDIYTPSVLMRRAVRTRAKRVALNITVPSLLRGMFMDTSRCKCTQQNKSSYVYNALQNINKDYTIWER